MLNNILGKKIGMTQIFSPEGEVIPVTVINVANCFVLQIKTLQNDGYAALKVGLVKNRYLQQPFNLAWCKNINKYFSDVREVRLADETKLNEFKVGKEIKLDHIELKEKDLVQVTGRSIGKGFQGVMKRWGFSGGFASHGSCFHRKPGAISHMRTQGEVIKGKKLPGQMGLKMTSINGLMVAGLNKENGFLFVKGAVPGKKDSLLVISRQG